MAKRVEPGYTVREAARLLKVSPTTIWRWIASGRLRARRVGPRKVRVSEEDLAAVIRPAREERYDPEAVRRAIAETAGAWADLDVDDLAAAVYRAREEGTRPVGRP